MNQSHPGVMVFSVKMYLSVKICPFEVSELQSDLFLFVNNRDSL